MANGKKFKIGFIGSGRIAERHANGLKRLKLVEFAAWSSMAMHSAKQMAKKFGGKAMSMQEMLAQKDIAAVLVCTPTFLHHEHVLRALDASKKVFCEKPLARTIAEADEMIAKSEGRIYAGHVLRFFHQYNRARQIIARGDLGQVKKVICRRLNISRPGSENWLHDPEKSGGVLLDLLIHNFDWLLWTFGKYESLQVRTDQEKDSDGWLHAIVELKWQNGMQVEVEGSYLHEKSESSLIIEGTQGSLKVAPQNPDEMIITSNNYERTIPLAGLPNPYNMQMQHFTGWLSGMLEPVVSLQEAREALSLSLQAIAARKHQ
jgi:predicted dehydrogenase